MRPLVAVRHAAAFNRRFLQRAHLFWPLARAAHSLGEHEDFPPIAALGRVFDGSPPVRFVEAGPRRRRGAPVVARALYDARITLDGEVPTRAGSWHDLMNALVWGTFPLAKQALHLRQHRAIAARVAPGACALPPTRTRELDALALVDEGGVAILSRHPEEAVAALRARDGEQALRLHFAAGAAHLIVFGHAIYESLALGFAPAVAAALVLAHDPSERDPVAAADRGLARVLEDERLLRSPDELRRVDVQACAPSHFSRLSAPPT